MRKRRGVVMPYQGPEKMHEDKLRQILSDARFMMKYFKYRDLEGFRLYVVVHDEIDRETHVIVRKEKTYK